MRIKGLSLIESLVTLVLIASFFVISISFSTHLKEKNELNSILDSLQAAIRYAKITAVTKRGEVSLSPKDSSKDWSIGLILSYCNKTIQRTEILYEWQWKYPGWEVTWVGASPKNQINFSNNPIHAMSNGRFVLTNQRSREKRVVVLNKLGRLIVKD